MPILYDIELTEVSLVDEGDNPEAHVVFFKRRAGQSPEGLSDERIAEMVKAALAEDGGPPVTTFRKDAMTQTPLARESGTQTVDRTRSDFAPDGREIRTTESIEVSTSMEVVEIASAEAQKLMASNPGEYGSIEAARNAVWDARPDLAKAYRDLPAAPARHRTEMPGSAPVLKGQATIDKVNTEAQKLVTTGVFKSLVSARCHVWETRPDLQEEYQQARAS